MTQTKGTRSSSKEAGGGDKWLGSHVTGAGTVSGTGIPADHFENEPGPYSGLKGLDAEQRAKFDAETERLKKFRKK